MRLANNRYYQPPSTSRSEKSQVTVFCRSQPADDYCKLCVDDDRKMTSKRIFSPLSSYGLFHRAKKLKFPAIHGSIQLRRTWDLRTSKDLQVMWSSLLGGLLWDLTRALSRFKGSPPKVSCLSKAQWAGTLIQSLVLCILSKNAYFYHLPIVFANIRWQRKRAEVFKA